MPEGHTLHRIAAEHRAAFAGGPVEVTSPQGKFVGADLVDGCVLVDVEAYGKHLFYEFEHGRFVHVHLGLFGRVSPVTSAHRPPRDTVRMRLANQSGHTDLVGATQCAVVTEQERAAVLNRLGPDPLRSDADPALAWQRLHRSRVSIAALLMDQRVVAGIGNVYRAELLFRAGLDPYLPGRQVSEATFLGMWHDVRRLMRAGLRSGRIVTTRPEHRSRSGRARRDDAHYVYRRVGLPCRICLTAVRSALLEGRTVYWCPEDQAPRR